MNYQISYQNPASQYLTVELEINDPEPEVYIRIAAWRPGRYELGNFSRNIRSWKAYDGAGNALPFEKTERERWKVTTNGAAKVVILYEYFAGILNAGSTFLDDKQLYMNPVNSLCYVEGREEQPHALTLHVPPDYQIATGLEKTGRNTLVARNYDQLADCPIIASNRLKHVNFAVQQLDVHLWFMGECKPDAERLKRDFTAFIQEQINAFGEFPEKDYHFLFQITPHKTHHGVEHENSTVCMIGPTYYLMTEIYSEFLELSSHEFYHSWNIKKIRPAEMMPYDFTKENYFRTGYVAEGVTTYYGDLMLYRAKVFNEKQYLDTVLDTLDKHFHNYGRLNMPVAEASFDAWVDGYEPGVPNRKTSIYTEGALCAMMEDILIIHHSGCKYSLDNVMYDLYHNFAKLGKGYTGEDYRMLLEKYSGISFKEFFEDYVYGCKPFDDKLKEVWGYVGMVLVKNPSNELYERNYGFKVSEENNKVTHIAPGSPAAEAGLFVGDSVATLNGFSLTNNIRHWFNYFKGETLELRVRTTDNRVRHLILPPSENNFYPDCSMGYLSNPTEEQQRNYERWTRHRLVADEEKEAH